MNDTRTIFSSKEETRYISVSKENIEKVVKLLSENNIPYEGIWYTSDELFCDEDAKKYSDDLDNQENIHDYIYNMNEKVYCQYKDKFINKYIKSLSSGGSSNDKNK